MCRARSVPTLRQHKQPSKTNGNKLCANGYIHASCVQASPQGLINLLSGLEPKINVRLEHLPHHPQAFPRRTIVLYCPYRDVLGKATIMWASTEHAQTCYHRLSEHAAESGPEHIRLGARNTQLQILQGQHELRILGRHHASSTTAHCISSPLALHTKANTIKQERTSPTPC